MKEKRRWFLVSAALILGIGVIGSGVSWGDDAGPPGARASADGQTVVAQAAPANTETPAQTTTPPAAPSTTTTTTAPGKVPTTEVTVTEQKPKPGSAAAGYKEENTTTTGPWGEMALQDTPYSILPMSSALIENVQASDPYQLFRINPLTSPSYKSTTFGYSYPNIRGLNVMNPLTDGVGSYIFGGEGMALEDKERVDIFSGANGFLFGNMGGTNVGGTINYILKRPTPTPYASVILGDYGGQQYYGHADLGGPIDKDGKLGYRTNLFDQPWGDTAVQDIRIHRDLFTGAFDWHAMDNLLFQVDYSHQEDQQQGQSANWQFPTSGMQPTPPDPDKMYAQKYAYLNTFTDTWGSKAKWDINDMFTVRAGYRHLEQTFDGLYVNNYLSANGTTYKQTLTEYGPYYSQQDSYYTYLDTKFKTWGIDHTLTAGLVRDRLCDGLQQTIER